MEKRVKTDQVKNKNGGFKSQVQKIKAKALKTYYGNPMRDMKLIAITGTTGKTTVAHFVQDKLGALGKLALHRRPPVLDARGLHF